LVLVGILTRENAVWIWCVATTGNTLGSAVNWVLGRYLIHFEHKPWFPFKGKSLQKAQQGFQKYGVWSLLFAWLPIGGDALTFIAGVMRVPFFIFIFLTAIGKGLRYLVVILLYFGVTLTI